MCVYNCGGDGVWWWCGGDGVCVVMVCGDKWWHKELNLSEYKTGRDTASIVELVLFLEVLGCYKYTSTILSKEAVLLKDSGSNVWDIG